MMTNVRTGSAIAHDTRSIADLRARVRGDVIDPEHATYEEARRVFNAAIDRRPALVVRCRDVADVVSTVRYAAERDLPIAVRCGAHNVAGFGTCDKGVVVDLSPMRSVRYDPNRHTATVDGGCTWGDVDHALHTFGRAVPGGIISTTGVGGLTLGGGMGHLTRHYGLSCDNLVSADVVTAQGELVTASGKENEELFWGLRGGGGNFGVVTSFEFRTHPVHSVYGGPIFWPYEKGGEVMRFYRDFMGDAPEELNVISMFAMVPPAPQFPAQFHGKVLSGAIVCWSGPVGNGERAVRPLLEFGPPAFALVGPMPHPTLQSMLDPIAPPGLHNYWKGDFVARISDELIETHMRHARGIPTPTSGVHIFPVSGAAHRVGSDETAFSFRDASYSTIIHSSFPDPADMPRIRDWTRAYWEDLRQYSAGGAYVNFMMEEGEERIAAAYRDNLPRLRDIKAEYDPRNRFCVNQNIAPRR